MNPKINTNQKSTTDIQELKKKEQNYMTKNVNHKGRNRNKHRRTTKTTGKQGRKWH